MPALGDGCLVRLADEVTEGQLLWEPDAQRREGTHLAAYLRWLERERGLRFADYDALWRWSVLDLEAFWQSIWDFFDVRSSSPVERVLVDRTMPGASWFPGARLNYAEHVLPSSWCPTLRSARTLRECSPSRRP